MNYWENYHFDLIRNAKTYSDLVYISFDILKKIPQPISQVCGPITTGGKGSIEKNLEIFKGTIDKLARSYNVFDQTPLEPVMQNIIKKKYEGLSKEESNLILLERFYGPILSSGLVKKLFFIDGWESSQGARWENEKGKELGIEIFYLSENFLKE